MADEKAKAQLIKFLQKYAGVLGETKLVSLPETEDRALRFYIQFPTTQNANYTEKCCAFLEGLSDGVDSGMMGQVFNVCLASALEVDPNHPEETWVLGELFDDETKPDHPITPAQLSCSVPKSDTENLALAQLFKEQIELLSHEDTNRPRLHP